MKFLCEHCKAKYQIADDKVAGRTVRMKCRKCGGAIEVRAAVTETSVAVKAADVAPAEAPPPRAHPPRASPLATSLSTRSGPSRPSPQNERALAGAFQRGVQREEDSALNQRELSAADEWYVAVNGVPVGPVRVGEVRRKAAMGAVTEDSLCWQEGMEEWRAIRTVTELAAVVREAASSGRTSVLPADPRPTPPPARPAPPRAPQAPRPRASPAAPAWAKPAAALVAQDEPEMSDDEAMPTIVGRSPLLDAEPEQHAALMNGSGAAPVAAADPFRQAPNDMFKAAAFTPPVAAFGAPTPYTPPAAPQAAAPAVAYGAPQAFANAPPAAAYPAPVAPPIVVPVASRRVSPIAVGMIVMFGCFGLMAAYFLFAPRPQAAVPVAQVAPVGSVGATAPTPTDIPPPLPATSGAASAAPPSAEAGTRVASANPRPAGGSTPAGAAPKPGAPAVTDPALRDLINGTGTGPSAAPGGPSAGGGAQLTQDETQAVVSQHSLAIRRTCWERSPSTTPSVSVKVHIVIAGSGQVSQATATGNDAVVSHCLEEEIKRWHWPGGGEVDVPFHFIRQ